MDASSSVDENSSRAVIRAEQIATNQFEANRLLLQGWRVKSVEIKTTVFERWLMGVRIDDGVHVSYVFVLEATEVLTHE